ncbi:hypothetical protein Q7M76_03830 [Candidatus Liberibacter asiaticus]|uniref:Lipoprotein n=1 Tax=Liberibacter asiaticus (strain psy62) TaxID=537021 RepID=C6XG56_LIBAP|nr:hypothetical protein [Candidatus Liberibacter asiaticus]BAP26646.1 hypothetical protein CGUJ_03915 [Candidatus Liberibacter asiaticus str. Ishi-1]ACT57359.1 hypothetical protein CLIBASIA_03915 [Candidatus Liberibacter asiaticus str. psy62]KAE9509929.1 hypothetical protein FXW22_03790 [Candidatus Liberibacter asiaticus]KAE9510689.1 hypothetical protein FXW31_05320 [Candidatus Liberibacter asiaticus]KAE9512062.1 hypothetical protein FXW32_03845 [Candidatus Liberibacter asiaticus]
MNAKGLIVASIISSTAIMSSCSYSWNLKHAIRKIEIAIKEQ